MSGKNTELYKGKKILAPMVKIGTLPMRLLALRYGADLVYSEEVVDWKILKSKRVANDMLGTIEYQDPSDGSIIFSTCEEERSKVIFQLGTSDPDRALQVLLHVQDDVAGIDLNMGCPKDFSIRGGMGAALLKKPDTVKAILTTLVTHAKIPVTCKIRVLPTLEATIDLAFLVQSCGISALAIHGRNVNERRNHRNRNEFIKAVAEKLDIPVIANGGSKEVMCYDDIDKFRQDCGTASVMLARAGEWNPSIFRKEGTIEMDEMIQEYLKLSVEKSNPFSFTKYTIQNILRELQETPRGKKFLATQTIGEICEIWNLKDFYKSKESEWETYKANKRPLDSSSSENESKKIKRDLPVDSSIIIVPDCIFLRGHYDNNEQLPKSMLLTWSRNQGFKIPKYTTEWIDKRFRSVVSVGGKDFMTNVWEKSKRSAEQAAALACVRFLKLSS